ncbi:MAG: hypothetical protein OXE78_03670 [Gammaproteobacteria bacterium]|nr:hypothetical protein [Gammaproteobacteria bacterium]MCY4358331.1 hypothetical protein [Gammaproteobacteria bacterium]
MKAKLVDEVSLLFFAKYLSDKDLQLPFPKWFRLCEGVNLNQPIRGGLPEFFTINATGVSVKRFPKFRPFGFSIVSFKVSQTFSHKRFNASNVIFKDLVAFIGPYIEHSRLLKYF